MAALYRPVFWEPVAGMDERIVAMIALEPDASSSILLSPASYVVIPGDRLRAMLGKQRGNAAAGILARAAEFITLRQQAGLPLDEIEAPFVGMKPGTIRRIRGYSVEQLLDASVRMCSAFGTSDAIIEDSDPHAARHTIRTAQFIASVRRKITTWHPELKDRFEKTLAPQQDLPPLTVDYATQKWLVQITSLPSTPKQFDNTQREAQSKLFEIDLIRKHMGGNHVAPILLVNQDALVYPTSYESENIARTMQERLGQLARANGMEVKQASNPEAAADLLMALQE